MLVYGDVVRLLNAKDLARSVGDDLESVAEERRGIARHERLRTAFLSTADLLTGLLDRDFERNGSDAHCGQFGPGMAALTKLAKALGGSWDSGFVDLANLEPAVRVIRKLEIEGTVRVKSMEGYSFYALYPESYWLAARRSGLPATARVIGIRSIGLSLAAMVAAGLGAAPPVTLRPVGHPFGRELRIDGEMEQELLSGNPSCFCIVDEGPGLSGSSFGAVADWLEERGISTDQIRFFPSHLNGLGAEASDGHRRRWSRAERHFVSTDDLLFGPDRRLEHWLQPLTGELDQAPQEMTGGGWRQFVRGGSELPVQGWWERRKFLARRGDERFLVKFTGFGRDNERKWTTAKFLDREGFGSAPVGIVGGFLVQSWSEEPNLTTVWLERKTLLDQLGRYLVLRNTLAADSIGASLVTLRDMAIHNAGEALGRAASDAVRDRLEHIEALQSAVQPVFVDGRMHRWEWLVEDEGRLLKTDAVDHASTHDFIGPQDIAWDVAGTIVEHELDGAEALQLTAVVGADPGLVDVLLPCYLAFQLGAWTMANGPGDDQVRRYREALSRLLALSRRL